MYDWAKVAGICKSMSERMDLTSDAQEVLDTLAGLDARQALALARAMKELNQ
jgi:hypothetical protein